MDDAFMSWLPSRRAEVHRTHGEVIAVRAERDRAALGLLPARPYVVCERHLRSVGKDCLVSFEASLYSVPWRAVRRRMRVELSAALGRPSPLRRRKPARHGGCHPSRADREGSVDPRRSPPGDVP